MRDTAVVEALTRIEHEFAAMPGLRLTPAQVDRLVNLPPDVCRTALDVLTRCGFLKITDGTIFFSAARPSFAPCRRVVFDV